MSLIGNFKLYIFLPSVLLLFINFERFLSKILKKIFNFLGNLTYGMYLWHLPIQIVMITIIKILNLKFDLIERELFFISYLLLVFSTSIFSYYFIEKKLRKKIKLKFKPT